MFSCYVISNSFKPHKLQQTLPKSKINLLNSISHVVIMGIIRTKERLCTLSVKSINRAIHMKAGYRNSHRRMSA